MYINKAIIYGNITKDIELKTLPSGSAVASFSVATNRTWKDKNGAKQESTDFHNVVAFGKTAELIAQYLSKGASIYVEGRIQTRSWDGQDGKKNYRTEIVVDQMQFGPKKAGSTAPKADDESAGATSEAVPGEEISVEDIPF